LYMPARHVDDSSSTVVTAADLIRVLPCLRVLVAGQGPHEAHLRAVAESLDGRGRIRFLGHCPDVRPVLAAADLFVLPSHREGLPNAVLEAMAVGVPVVATAVDGTGEVVTDGETGLLVPPHDPDALDHARQLAGGDEAGGLGEAAVGGDVDALGVDVLERGA